MKKLILIFAAGMLTAATTFAQQSTRKINIGLVPPLSSNWTSASRDTNSFSLNAIAGLSASETGFALAGFGNFVKHNTNGFLVAGFMNTSGGGHGTAIAGFGNFSKSTSGTQIAGFGNFSKSTSGTQIAGFANSSGNISGMQLAGFMNVAKNVKGVQISGFINIADTANCQVGFINVSKNGEMTLGVTYDENETLMLSLRSGGKFLYGIIGAGYNVANKKDVYAYQAGLGAHIVRAETFLLNAELTNSALLNFKGLTYYRAAFAALPSLRLVNHIDLFAGPSFVYMQTNSSEDMLRHKKYISSWGGKNGDDFRAFYIGYNAGVAIRL
ncbi:MAG TPA: hypothetical protein VIM89_20305 [Mucilaginibacter sp.]